MRKQSKWRLLACTALSIAAIPAFMACDALTGIFGGSEEEKKNNIVNVYDGVDINVAYDQETGIVSWGAIEGAVKYEVAVNLRHQATEFMEKKETTQTQYQLELKKGYNLISVWAYNADGVEIAVGSVNVKLELDYGAPDPVENIAYNETTKTFTWDGSENAAKYIVTATNLLDSTAKPIVKETSEASVNIGVETGVYNVSVVGVSAKGAKGYASEYEWFSYVDADFNKTIEGTDLINILNFDNERILETMGLSDYAGWLTNGKDATGTIEEEVWYYASLDDKEADVKTTDDTNATKSLFLNQPVRESGNFEGVTFIFPETIPVEELGVITYDLFRASTPGVSDFYVGVVLEDENGTQSVHPVAWLSQGNPELNASKFSWGKVTIDGRSILEKAPTFQGIRKISLTAYNGKGGAAYFDNFAYDPFGTVGEVSYDKETKTVSWDKVIGATSYELTVNGEVVYTGSETSYTFETGLDANSAISADVQLKAIREADGVVRTRETEDLTLNFFGEVGALTYNADTLKVAWKAVDGAESYKLEANGEVLYEGTETSFVFETAPASDMSMTLTAIRGETEKSKEVFVCVCEKALAGTSCTGFATATGAEGAYYLADFSNHNYYDHFTYDRCTVTNEFGGVKFKVSSAWNSKFTFTFPKAVTFAKTADETDVEMPDPLTISVRFKDVASGTSLIARFIGLDDNIYYITAYGWESPSTITSDGDWKIATFKLTDVKLKVDDVVVSNLLECGGIKGFYFTLNTVGESVIGSVVLNRDMTNFNKETSEGSGEYILADFNSSQYQSFVKKTGWATSDLDKEEVANGALNLVIDHSWGNGAVTYTLPSSVALSQMKTIIFKVKEPTELAISLIDTNGNSGGGNFTSSYVTVSEEADENGYYTFTFDVAKRLADTTNNTLTLDSVITKLQLMNRSAGNHTDGKVLPLTIDSITYTKA